jgi:hypothetical protein
VNTTTGPEILVVTENDATTDAIERMGGHVTGCGGPQGSTCPIVEGDGCPMVDAAAGVVFELDLDDPYNTDILRCYRRTLGPLVPIVVVTDSDRSSPSLDGVAVTSELDDADIGGFIDRVELAAMARSALAELAGARPGPEGRRAGF